jgi:hypothetical protein
MEYKVPRQSCHSEALSAGLDVFGNCVSVVLLDDLEQGNLHTGKMFTRQSVARRFPSISEREQWQFCDPVEAVWVLAVKNF